MSHEFYLPSQEEVNQKLLVRGQVLPKVNYPSQNMDTPPTIVTVVDRKGPLIAVKNLSTVVSDQELLQAVGAIQIQLDRDWQPAWSTTATLEIYSVDQVIPDTHWSIFIMDSSDVEQALGYHGETYQSRPYARVFAKDAASYGQKWTVTFSHEVLEMMGNPWINLNVFHEGQSRLYAYESCDAVENDRYGYEIQGVMVSDFQYPAWFDETPRVGARFDHMGHCKTSFEILPGGYMPIFDVTGGSGWKVLRFHQESQDPQPNPRLRPLRHALSAASTGA